MPAAESDLEEVSSDASEGSLGSELSASDDESDWDQGACCGPLCTAKRWCHACYVLQLCLYIILFPMWCKYLVTAPKPERFWNEEWPDFPLIVPIRDMRIALTSDASPQIDISPLPKSGDMCNFTCSKQLHKGQQTDEMNFPMQLSLNVSKSIMRHGKTLFPVVLTSSDFKHWQVAADRRDASPEGFWRFRSDGVARGYSMVSPPCTRPRSASYGMEASYVLACVSWRASSVAALQAAKTFEAADFAAHCDALGGICGWSCGSSLPSQRLPLCSADSELDVEKFASKYSVGANFSAGKVAIKACLSSRPFDRCVQTEEPLPRWKCHRCVADVVSEAKDEDETADGDDADAADTQDEDDAAGGLPGLPGLPGVPVVRPPGIRRLRAGKSLDDLDMGGVDDDERRQIYMSLPRLRVTLAEAEVPKPHVYLFTASTLEGPFQPLYETPDPEDPDAPSPPMTYEEMERQAAEATDTEEEAKQAPELTHTMSSVDFQQLDITPVSCYGRRGPLYVVVCALNQSAYALAGAEKGFQEFERGQAAAPPPFNDRCLAVAGRCGVACENSRAAADAEAIPHCLPDGRIDPRALLGEIEAPSNRQTCVWMFVYVLLLGFSYKVFTLFPGVFKPFAHYTHYTPKLTERFGYIVVVTPSAGGDENKRTTVRNLVGSIAAMPPDIRCRYHVVLLDELHRVEMKRCWRRLADVVAAIPGEGSQQGFQDNLHHFFGAWCEETKKLDLQQIGSKVEVIDEKVLDRVCGHSALQVVKQEYGWDMKALEALEVALAEFREELRHDNDFSREAIKFDDLEDWSPRHVQSLLRLHYVARARPFEDERTNRVQHVAPGTWYYTVPEGASPQDWLALRRGSQEMVYGIARDEPGDKVPLRACRGKAGGLNFVHNYMRVLAARPENRYNDEQDGYPSLFSVAHARHQYQADFMVSMLPYFFNRRRMLNKHVAFAQSPLHYFGSLDKTDYLDTNHASWFRMTCMIRNCVGGVFSCGTNCIWLVPHDEGSDSVWASRRSRVNGLRKYSTVERTIFSEDSKVEDTASSLQAVLAGQRSQFVNRKLSYGMAKADLGSLASRQRWTEGGVVLGLQLLFSCGAGLWMMLFAALCGAGFMVSLLRLVTWDVDVFLVQQLGLVSQEGINGFLDPVDLAIHNLLGVIWNFNLLGSGVEDTKIFARMLRQIVMWLVMVVVLLTLLWAVSTACKPFRRMHRVFPSGMRWWCRLWIALQSLTDFLWFWTAFFWIGFNCYVALVDTHSHFEYSGMMFFMLAVNVVSWGMAISNSSRYSLSQSMEANEIANMSADNFWRANQLFYMMAPVHLYSIGVGIREYWRWRFFGIDISHWEGDDDPRGDTAMRIVKHWTLLLVLGPVAIWVISYVNQFGQQRNASWAARIVLTIVALDMLHPCAFLWVGREKSMRKSLTDEQARKMSWSQAVSESQWWRRTLRRLILNPALASILKYVGPAYFLLLPLTCWLTPWFGVNAAFMLVTPV